MCKRIFRRFKRNAKPTPITSATDQKTGLSDVVTPTPNQHQVGVAEESSGRVKRSFRKLIWGLVVGFIGVLVVLLVIAGLGIYKYHWTNAYLTRLTEIIPYPAAIVNYHPISYSDFESDVKTLSYYMDRQATLSGGTTYQKPDLTEIRKETLDRLVNDELMRQVARKQGVSVSDDEVNQEYAKIVSDAGGEDKVQQTLSEEYMWTVEQFKAKAMKPLMLETKLQEKIAFSDDLTVNQEAKKKADEVYAKIINKEITFEDAAKQYSSDTSTASSGGDLGEFALTDMVSQFQQALLQMNEGDISKPVRTIYGFHIIKLVQKGSTDVTGSDTTTTAKAWKASHILIATQDFQAWFQDQTKSAKIYRLVQ